MPYKSIDFKTNLKCLDYCIEKLLPIFDAKQKDRLKAKISNIRNTSFWDITGELWFAQELLKDNKSIRIDFPLHTQIKKKLPYGC